MNLSNEIIGGSLLIIYYLHNLASALCFSLVCRYPEYTDTPDKG